MQILHGPPVPVKMSHPPPRHPPHPTESRHLPRTPSQSGNQSYTGHNGKFFMAWLLSVVPRKQTCFNSLKQGKFHRLYI